MMRADLEAAGIHYRDASGLFFGFHSPRCQVATMADTAGVTPRVVQRLMRHSTLELTGRYTRPRAVDIEAAASMLPSLKPTGDRPESLAATGTDGPVGHRHSSDRTGPDRPDPEDPGVEGQSISKVFGHHLATGGDVSGRDQRLSDVITLSNAPGSMDVKTPEKKPSDASRRVPTAPDGSVPKVGLEPTRVLPHRILSPARLPFRHFGKRSGWRWCRVVARRAFDGRSRHQATLYAESCRTASGRMGPAETFGATLGLGGRWDTIP